MIFLNIYIILNIFFNNQGVKIHLLRCKNIFVIPKLENFSAVSEAVISSGGNVYDFLAEKLKLKHSSQVLSIF